MLYQLYRNEKVCLEPIIIKGSLKVCVLFQSGLKAADAIIVIFGCDITRHYHDIIVDCCFHLQEFV